MMNKRQSMHRTEMPFLRKLSHVVSSGLLFVAGWGVSWGGGDIAYAEPLLPAESTVQMKEEAGITVDPKLEDLTFFQNRWRCVIEKMATELDEDQASQDFTWDMIRQLNDLWFFAISYQKPKEVSEVETWGYNTIIQKYGRTITGNDGKFANFLSDGWQGNTMVWRGSSLNMVNQTTGKHQIMITKTNDTSFTEVEQRLTAEEEWETIATRTCTLPEG